MSLSGIGDLLLGPDPYQSATQVREDEMQQIVAMARAAGLPEWQINDLYRNSSSGASAAEVRRLVQQYIDQGRQNQAVDEQQAKLQQATDEYGRSLGAVQGRVQGNIDRYSRLLRTPGAVRSDAEYGAALSSAEQAIAAQVQQQKDQAAQSTSQSGLRSSGRGASTALRDQEYATNAGNQIRQNMYGDIIGRKQGAQDQWNQLETQRGQLKLGQFPQYSALEGSRTRTTWDPVDDVLTPGLSREAAVRGENMNMFGIGAGLVQNGVNSMSNAGTSLINKFGN